MGTASPSSTTALQPALRFIHSAAGHAKKTTRVQNMPPFDFLSGAFGEDAYFRRHDALGVADGVGGWRNTANANSALFSRKLMHYASAECARFEDVDDEEAFCKYDEADPVQVMTRSYEQAARDAFMEGMVGSCTACVVLLRSNELRIANLGDCGVMVIRDNDCVFRSEEQQHSFNFPFQLGTGSPDRPTDAQNLSMYVKTGDVVILGTDGLFDNVFDDEILALVDSSTRYINKKRVLDPVGISDKLAQRALDTSIDTRAGMTPFSERAVQEGMYHQGGKMDDITVVVGVVSEAEDSPDRRWLD
jgi:serine/threonine protein phosphatase PrpC